MSGHSKWATIKHKKGAADKARGKLFAKLARQIEVAARAGGGDPDMNPTLRSAVAKAKGSQMTNDAIDRAIKRGTGDAGGQSYEAITYEGYAPCGVALMIEVLTDNRNRTDKYRVFSHLALPLILPLRNDIPSDTSFISLTMSSLCLAVVSSDLFHLSISLMHIM